MLLPRVIALVGALAAAVLVLFPLPFSDLLVMAPLQLFIALGVLLTSGRRMNPLRLGVGVLGYAALGCFISLVLCNMIFLIGKLFAAPFAFVWCYGLGELVLLKGRKAA